MVGQVILVAFYVPTVLLVIASPNENIETPIVKHQLTQLEETVSDLQKHIVAQDQKQTAVLSTVLSRLTVTTEELTKLQHNYTVLENELSSLKMNSTSVDGLQKHMVAQEQKQTAVLSSLLSRLMKTTDKLTETTEELAKLQNNHTVLQQEFISLKDNYTSVNGAGKGYSHQEVAFEARMVVKGVQDQYKTFLEYSTLIFPTIQNNEGGCWNPSTGVFTASVNGTYLFWIDLTFTDVDGFTLLMKRNNEIFNVSYGRLLNQEDMFTTNLISLTNLIEGDIVQYVANKKVKYWSNGSSCGGVLLHYREKS